MKTSKINHITIKDLKELSKLQNSARKISIPAWKIAVKEWATKHDLTDREAVKLARIAKENFSDE